MEEEKKQETNVLDKTKEEVERIIKQITENGLQTANVELLYKLIDVHKDIENENYWKEKENMHRGRDYFMDDSYGRQRDSRGRYMDSYGRRGVPGSGRRRYRGEEMIDEMSKHYGDYNEGRETYGNDRETEKSFEKMLQSLEDFTYLLMQEADSPDKIEKVKMTARKISEM